MADQGATVSELVDALPRYALIKRKFECPPEKVPAALDAVAAAFADQRVDRSDGVRVEFPDSWVLLRPSNTEPIVRIMAEASDAGTAEALGERVREAAGL
jgi:phosphomannomutase